MSKFTSAAAAAVITAAIGLPANVAASGPAFDPKPYLSDRSSQEILINGCGAEECKGILSATVYFDSNGTGEIAYFFLQELAPKARFANCPFNPGDQHVREDAGFALVNTTVDVADCFVTETCDENGMACTPDYEGKITVAAALRRPRTMRSTSGSIQTRSEGIMSTSTCQTKEGSEHAEVTVSVDGDVWMAQYSSAAKRDCKEVGKSR